MASIGKDFISATRYVGRLCGGSQPILVQASDGHYYVIKFANNLQGANLPFNESAGTLLYRAFGLPCPSWKSLVIADSFLDRNPQCWIHDVQGSLRPTSGLCFGSLFVGNLGARPLEILSGASFSRIRNPKLFWLAWMVDICARHADNRQALFLEDATGRLTTVFVDHGHLFGGPNGEKQSHFSAPCYLDRRIYECVSSSSLEGLPGMMARIDLKQLALSLQTVPEEWKTSEALRGFAECLSRLSDLDFLRATLSEIVNFQRQREKCDQLDHNLSAKLPLPVQYSGPPQPQRRPQLASATAGFPACAVQP